MAVHFTFASVSKAVQSVPCVGDSISLADLKDAIAVPLVAALKGKKLKENFDFRVYDWETKQEILGANTAVRKNASVLVKRVPAFIVSQQKLPIIVQKQQPVVVAQSNGLEDDEFGEDVYSTTSTVTSSKEVEKEVETEIVKKVEVVEKVEKERRKNEVLVQVPVQVPSCAEIEIPVELVCTLCKNVMKEPVLIPCCCNSFCSECIRVALLVGHKKCPKCESCKCGEADLLPNRHIKAMIDVYFKKNNNNNSSASNVVSSSSGSCSSQTTSSSIRVANLQQTNSSSIRVADVQQTTPYKKDSNQKTFGVRSGFIGKRKPLVISLNGGKKRTKLT